MRRGWAKLRARGAAEPNSIVGVAKLETGRGQRKTGRSPWRGAGIRNSWATSLGTDDPEVKPDRGPLF